MSFKRYREIYRPMMRRRVEAGREAASRWSAPSPAIRPRRDNARSCSSFDESPAGYSWQVALQQRLLPLHQPRSFCYEWERRASKNQRTANSGLTGCLSSGVHRTVDLRILAPTFSLPSKPLFVWVRFDGCECCPLALALAVRRQKLTAYQVLLLPLGGQDVSQTDDAYLGDR